MTYKRRIILAGALTALFILFLILVKTVNVAPIGPNGTEVGFSNMNKTVHEGIGVHLGWYRMTEVLGILAILAAGGLALLGLLQWITRKKLLKIDPEILAAGLLFLLTVFFYFFFEKVIINYRPVIMPGESEPEASFPSSHTMLIITVMGCIMLLSEKYAPNMTAQIGVCIFCMLIILLTVIGRFVSGVHWMTDIIGGILLGVTLLAWFRVGIRWMRKLQKRFSTWKAE